MQILCKLVRFEAEEIEQSKPFNSLLSPAFRSLNAFLSRQPLPLSSRPQPSALFKEQSTPGDLNPSWGPRRPPTPGLQPAWVRAGGRRTRICVCPAARLGPGANS
ncbi:hypothetical protein VULLAG_LOCUS22708 [Vulpes lagopus]